MQTIQSGLKSPRWTFPFWAFLLSRAAILLETQWSLAMDPRLHRPGGPLQLPALQGLCRWDCGWFETIALHGYVQPTYANFFPLFPLIGKAVSTVTQLPLSISFVLSANAIALVSLVVIYRIFSELEGEAVARVAVALFVAWPFSFFQAAGYPESIMVLTTALAVLWSQRGQHIRAGTALGVGILARHLTIVGGFSLLAAQVQQRGIRPRQLLWNRAALGLVMPFAIASLYGLFLWVRFGDPAAWWKARQQGWGEPAWYGLMTFFRYRVWEPQIGIYVLLSIIPGVGAFMLLRKREWRVMAAYAIALMVLLWAIGLMGLGRYTGSCWAAFLPMAVWLERRPFLQLPTVSAFAVLQGMFLYLFVHSYPIN